MRFVVEIRSSKFHSVTEKKEVSKPLEKKTISSILEKSEPVSIETIYTRRLFDFLYRGFEHTLYNQVLSLILEFYKLGLP